MHYRKNWWCGFNAALNTLNRERSSHFSEDMETKKIKIYKPNRLGWWMAMLLSARISVWLQLWGHVYWIVRTRVLKCASCRGAMKPDSVSDATRGGAMHSSKTPACNTTSRAFNSGQVNGNANSVNLTSRASDITWCTRSTITWRTRGSVVYVHHKPVPHFCDVIARLAAANGSFTPVVWWRALQFDRVELVNTKRVCHRHLFIVPFGEYVRETCPYAHIHDVNAHFNNKTSYGLWTSFFSITQSISLKRVSEPQIVPGRSIWREWRLLTGCNA